ncbi:hypothetical protein C0995_004640, partial [Termitomyces sp. Mi166
VKDKERKKLSSKITVTPSGRTTFTLKGDANAIAAYIVACEGRTTAVPIKTEFAGLASDSLSSATIEDIEELEFDAMIVLEEEERTGIDWHCHTDNNRIGNVLGSDPDHRRPLSPLNTWPPEYWPKFP